MFEVEVEGLEVEEGVEEVAVAVAVAPQIP